MRARSRVFMLTVATASTSVFLQGQAPPAPNTDIHYQLGPDSFPRDGVPKGDVRGPFTLPSEAYPGTQHTYWVYVPGAVRPGGAGQPDDLQRRAGVHEHGRRRCARPTCSTT